MNKTYTYKVLRNVALYTKSLIARYSKHPPTHKTQYNSLVYRNWPQDIIYTRSTIAIPKLQKWELEITEFEVVFYSILAGLVLLMF